ncbi:hypothetical protein B0H19DRAFT_1065873 [Mycena capillaripes]|nr:hypothetical protein B0H19DRAFT_1065873 [Mycena capillaripes]
MRARLGNLPWPFGFGLCTRQWELGPELRIFLFQHFWGVYRYERSCLSTLKSSFGGISVFPSILAFLRGAALATLAISLATGERQVVIHVFAGMILETDWQRGQILGWWWFKSEIPIFVVSSFVYGLSVACASPWISVRRPSVHAAARKCLISPAPSTAQYKYQSQQRVYGPISKPSNPESDGYASEPAFSDTSSSRTDLHDVLDSEFAPDDFYMGSESTDDARQLNNDDEASQDLGLDASVLLEPKSILREHWKDRNFAVADIESDSEASEEGTESEDDVRDKESDAENPDQDPDIWHNDFLL